MKLSLLPPFNRHYIISLYYDAVDLVKFVDTNQCIKIVFWNVFLGLQLYVNVMKIYTIWTCYFFMIYLWKVHEICFKFSDLPWKVVITLCELSVFNLQTQFSLLVTVGQGSKPFPYLPLVILCHYDLGRLAFKMHKSTCLMNIM